MSFKSWTSYCIFRKALIDDCRYLLNKEAMSFLQDLKETIGSRIEVVPAGTVFWRSQVGHSVDIKKNEVLDSEFNEADEYEFQLPFPATRMKPLKEKTKAGRANVEKIPCLYVATDKNTAMSEAKPWRGATLTLAKIQTTRTLRLVDFSASLKNGRKFHLNPSQDQINDMVLSDIDYAFSEPVNGDDSVTDYIPTQCIAEYIKSLGFDGVKYKSLMSDGHNVALFDLDCADIFDLSVKKVKSIKYEFFDVDVI